MQATKLIPLITGANRGIGKAYIQAYLDAGVTKIYAAARNRSDLDEVVAFDSKRVIPIVLDVTKPEQVTAAANFASDVNVLVNNAGALTSGSPLDVTASGLQLDLDVNYFGLIRTTQAFVPVLEKNGGGVVVNMLSVVSFARMPGISGYNASKAAAWSMTQAFRAQLATRNIRVVGVFPGPIDTDMAKEIPMAKTPPIDVANEVIQGIANGAEDIFPDPMSKQVYAAWSADHKSVEKQFGSS